MNCIIENTKGIQIGRSFPYSEFESKSIVLKRGARIRNPFDDEQKLYQVRDIQIQDDTIEQFQ